MGTEETQQADSLDDELRAAWEASEEAEVTTAASVEQETETSVDETEEVEETEETGETEETESTDTEETDEEETEGGTIQPPEDWSEEWAAEFRKLPDEGRQVLLNAYRYQQADYTRKTQEIAEIRKAIPDEMKQQLQLKGVSEGQYIQSLTAADRYLRQSPKEAIEYLANSYGVDLKQFADDGSEDDLADPEVSRLRNEVTELRTRLQQRDQREQQSQQATVNQQVQQFAEEKDESGKPRHPHFETVKPHMGALLSSGAAESLSDAYEQAIWARPDLRQELLAQQQREQQAEAEASRKKKASRAKKAATPAGSGTTATETEQPDDLRAALEKQFDEQTT